MSGRKQNWGYFLYRGTNIPLYRVCSKIETFLNEEDFLKAVKMAMENKCDFEVAYTYDVDIYGTDYRYTNYPIMPRSCYKERDFEDFEFWHKYYHDNGEKRQTYHILYAKVIPENEMSEKEKAYNLEYYVD